MSDFDIRLNTHLKKCEIEFTAKECPRGRCIPWLENECDNTEQIAAFLRSLGFRVKEIVEKQDAPDGSAGWVETTGGVLVFANLNALKGFVAGSARS